MADLDYPVHYQALGLPQYENTTITDLGRDSLRYQIFTVSKDNGTSIHINLLED